MLCYRRWLNCNTSRDGLIGIVKGSSTALFLFFIHFTQNIFCFLDKCVSTCQTSHQNSTECAAGAMLMPFAEGEMFFSSYLRGFKINQNMIELCCSCVCV